MIPNLVILTEKLFLAGEALIHPDDLGVLRGYGVFDVLKTVNGKIFLFGEHFKRLNDSADYLGVKLTAKKTEIKEAIKKLIAINKNKASFNQNSFDWRPKCRCYAF